MASLSSTRRSRPRPRITDRCAPYAGKTQQDSVLYEPERRVAAMTTISSPPPPVQIRLAEAADLPELTHVAAEAMATISWLFALPQDFSPCLDVHGAGFVVGAWWQHQPLGFCTVTLRNGTARVGVLSVAPLSRRRGIASRMLAYAEHEVVSRGCRRLEGWTAEELCHASMFLNAAWRLERRKMVHERRDALRPFCELTFAKLI
jgi:GNAT superfamily N-acetyltransferase